MVLSDPFGGNIIGRKYKRLMVRATRGSALIHFARIKIKESLERKMFKLKVTHCIEVSEQPVLWVSNLLEFLRFSEDRFAYLHHLVP